MKISDIKNTPTGISGIGMREDRKTDIAGRGISFGETIRRTGEANLEERLNRLMAAIEKQGELLAKNVDIKEFREYKKLVKEFMDEAVNGSLKFTTNSSFDRRGRHKVYANIKKVNAKLEELTREFLKQEKDNLKVLESIDSIRGLLLDMYM